MAFVLGVVEIREEERERRVGRPEEVVMDAHCKECRTADKKGGQSPI
jgi:hypothetical protein